MSVQSWMANIQLFISAFFYAANFRVPPKLTTGQYRSGMHVNVRCYRILGDFGFLTATAVHCMTHFELIFPQRLIPVHSCTATWQVTLNSVDYVRDMKQTAIITPIPACCRQLWRHCCQSNHCIQFPRRRCSWSPDVLLAEFHFHRQVELLVFLHNDSRENFFYLLLHVG